jgi:hypothetical protein
MIQIRERRVTQAQVAEHLSLSVRQVERLYRAYKTGGAGGLVSRKRGRPSPRKLPESIRREVILLVRERYADFGPTLAHEKLTESHGVRVSVETLRQWMKAEGIWRTRAERRPRAYPPRLRRACLGELVQIDGCDHEWFEDRAPRCVLLVYVDDATGRLMQLRFVQSESAFSYFDTTRGYLEQHGKPVAFYSDKASIFRVNAKQPKSGDGATQFARAMDELNIDILCANTPQAKGRVERAHQTLQDRLVKELRLRNISTIEAANGFVPRFIADYNRRFAREPASRHDVHRPLRGGENLAEIFRWKETRKVSQNLTIHYQRSLYVLQETPQTMALRGRLVEVHELEDGTVHLWHRGVELAAKRFRKDAGAGGVRQKDVDDNKYLATILQRIRQDQIASDEQKLTGRRTHREKALIQASIEQRRAR